MIRAATPLSVLLFIAFALELLAVLSTPIIKAIPLATYEQTTYGVFGFCQKGVCTSISVGYPDDNNSNFSLPANTRKSLSYLLIVHPIAALLTLVCFVLAVLAHLHRTSHSTRYLLGLVIFMLPTFLVSLLAFLVDVLLFIPNVGWGGWIVLAATLLIVVCGVLTCAMRRTIVSRKARKARIADNPEMSGENFFARREAPGTAAGSVVGGGGAPAISPPPLPNHAAGPPMVNGAPGANGLPPFAIYDQKSPVHDDDRTPLNARSGFSTSQSGSTENGVYGPGPPAGGMYNGRGGGGRGGMYTGARDAYGNPMDPSAAFGRAPSNGRDGPYGGGAFPHRQPSNETMGSQYAGRGRGGGGRGGGYPPRGYGRGGPYRGRGGPAYGYPRGGALGPAPGARGPPPGYASDYGAPPPHAGPYGPGGGGGGYAASHGPAPLPRQISQGSSSYGPSPPPLVGGMMAPTTAYASYAPPRRASPASSQHTEQGARAESPPPMPGDPMVPMVGQAITRNAPQLPPPEAIGQAIEMDAVTGSPARSPVPHELPHEHPQVRDSDSDVMGMVGLQQDRHTAELASPTESGSGYASSQARNDSYAPPRAAWQEHAPRVHTPPLGAIASAPPPPDPPAEAARRGPSPARSGAGSTRSHHRPTTSDNYYEDVDPRFTEPAPAPAATGVPQLLLPGGGGGSSYVEAPDAAYAPHHHQPLQHGYAPQGVRGGGGGGQMLDAGAPAHDDGSVGESEASHFTSVSQRGVNPNWQPGGEYSGPGGGGPPGRRGPPPPHQQPPQRDYVLAGNPEFALPANRGGRAPGRGGRAVVPPGAGGVGGGGWEAARSM